MRCDKCKHWKEAKPQEYLPRLGVCDEIKLTDKVEIDLQVGWEGGFVDEIWTDEDFGCTLFAPKVEGQGNGPQST